VRSGARCSGIVVKIGQVACNLLTRTPGNGRLLPRFALKVENILESDRITRIRFSGLRIGYDLPDNLSRHPSLFRIQVFQRERDPYKVVERSEYYWVASFTVRPVYVWH
jgi:hypothetical protein